MIWCHVASGFPVTSECLMAMLTVVYVESIWMSSFVSLLLSESMCEEKSICCVTVPSVVRFFTEDVVAKTPRALELQLRLLKCRPVHLTESMPEFTVAQVIEIEREGAQSGRASLALRARSTVRLDYVWVSWLSRFVVMGASRLSLPTGRVGSSFCHPQKLCTLQR